MMLGLVFALVIGLVLAIGSAFYLFAIGMSDNPMDGRPILGCGLTVVGMIIFATTFFAILTRLF